MTYPFRPRSGHIVVFTEIWGPLRSHVFKLALDTGATGTVVKAESLNYIGYDLSLFPTVSMTTLSGSVQVPDVTVTRIEALGQTRSNFLILAHNMPSDSPVDGVLGLDFLRGYVLNIDFRLGKLALT